MRFRIITLLISAAVLIPSVTQAQDFGVVESAETIDRGTFKLRVNPMFILGDDGRDGETGVAAHVGYGFTDRFDVEVGAALYDNIRLLGVDGEYWLVRDANLNMSVIGGVHIASGDRTADTRSFDLTLLASTEVNDRLEFYGGLDMAFSSITEPNVDFSYETYHLVPGLEYRLARDLDLLGEIGLGLNDDSWHYISVGLAVYFR